MRHPRVEISDGVIAFVAAPRTLSPAAIDAEEDILVVRRPGREIIGVPRVPVRFIPILSMVIGIIPPPVPRFAPPRVDVPGALVPWSIITGPTVRDLPLTTLKSLPGSNRVQPFLIILAPLTGADKKKNKVIIVTTVIVPDKQEWPNPTLNSCPPLLGIIGIEQWTAPLTHGPPSLVSLRTLKSLNLHKQGAATPRLQGIKLQTLRTEQCNLLTPGKLIPFLLRRVANTRVILPLITCAVLEKLALQIVTQDRISKLLPTPSRGPKLTTWAGGRKIPLLVISTVGAQRVINFFKLGITI